MQHTPGWARALRAARPARNPPEQRLRPPARGRRNRIAISAAAAVLGALMCAGVPSAQDPAYRLELEALLQEGALLRDELDRLRPLQDKLAEEGSQLDAEDRSLRAESQALNQEIQAFNAALSALEKAAQAHQARCPRESADSALVEACNTEAAGIRAQAQERDIEGPALKQRQQELNSSIEQHNAVRQEWVKRKGKHDAQVELNRHDLTAWLERVQGFVGTDAFRAAYRAAGSPPACRPEGLQDLAATPARGTLERVLGCMHALEDRA